MRNTYLAVFFVLFTSAVFAQEDGKAENYLLKTPYHNKDPYLRRGVEVEYVYKGMVRSRPHNKRSQMKVFTLELFAGGRAIPLGTGKKIPSIGEYVDKAAKVTMLIKPEYTGANRGEAPAFKAIELMDEAEGKRLLKEKEERKVAENARTRNPSPNALPFSGAWGVRLPLPSEKNGSKNVTDFDVAAFAKQVSELKTATHVILGVTHPATGMYFTGPHPELEKILQTRTHLKGNKYPNRGSFPKRDLLGEVIDAVRATGKKTLVYFACGGFSHGKKEGLKDAWFKHIESQRMNHYEAVGKLILTHYAQRYGTKIDGWWFDGAGALGQAGRIEWRKIVLDANPKAIMTFNRMAGPPFRASSLCDITGGHPTPRSAKKFWDDVNLPLITAIEESPWMTSNGEPVKDPERGVLGHVFIGLQDRWCSGKCEFPPEQAIEWTTRVVSAGGMYTWSVPCTSSGMADDQFKLLLNIDKAVAAMQKK